MCIRDSYCLYHSPCADGMSAAYAVWRLWGDKVVYLPMNYGQHIPMMQPGSKLIFLDFVFPRPIMEDLAKQHHEIIVLDHHQTAVEQLDGIEDEYTNILTVFDKARSGAMLA